MVENGLIKFLSKMPKVELHLHLEGSILPETAFYLMKKNNPGGAPPSVDFVERMYRFGNLTEFVYGMRNVTDHIMSIEDLKLVLCELLKRLVEQNVVYVEYDCAIQKYLNLGIPLEEIVENLWECSQQYLVEFGIESRMIVNAQRSHGAESVASLAQKIISLNHPYIIGFGLSGDESRYPQSFYREAFELLADSPIKRTVHAGEGKGAESVWDAIKVLKAERIDHGTRAVEDPSLVDFLAEKQIPLTQCITSNLRLNIVPDISSHPFGHFLRKKVVAALHTDDPAIFQTSLTDEYILAAENFNLDINDFKLIASNSVHSSFLEESKKKDLADSILLKMEQLIKSDLFCKEEENAN